MMGTKQQTAAKDACRAHTDLNVFYSIIAILEGGTIGADSFRDGERIITICKSASAKCLKRYDAALAKIGEKP